MAMRWSKEWWAFQLGVPLAGALVVGLMIAASKMDHPGDAIDFDCTL